MALNTPFNDSILVYETTSVFSKVELGKFIFGSSRKEEVVGCIIEKDLIDLKGIEVKRVKPAIDLVEDYFSLQKEDLDFFKWVSMYYHYPLGKLIKDIIPKVLKKPRTVKSLVGNGCKVGFSLNLVQSDCVKTIEKGLGKGFSKMAPSWSNREWKNRCLF